MNTPREWEEEFDELSFVSCPTEQEEPFYWRWTEEGKSTLKSFIRTIEDKAREEERNRVLTDVMYAFGKYYPISGTELDDLPTLAKNIVGDLRESFTEEERERVRKLVEGMKQEYPPTIDVTKVQSLIPVAVRNQTISDILTALNEKETN